MNSDDSTPRPFRFPPGIAKTIEIVAAQEGISVEELICRMLKGERARLDPSRN